MNDYNLTLSSQGWILNRVDPRADGISYWEDPESGIVFDMETALRIADGQQKNIPQQHQPVSGTSYSWVA